MLVTIDPNKFGKVGVVGDLHGDLHTLQALQKIADFKSDLIVFLGDYADRGHHGVEVIRAVSTLREEHPDNVVLLKGNHEDFTEKGEPNFNPCTLIDEAEAKVGCWGNYFAGELKPFLDSLPLCCLVSSNALLVHGGVSSKIKSVRDLEVPSEMMRMDLLWSDPVDGEGEDPNYSRGAGVEFGADISRSVCQVLGVNRIIRSHQPQLAATKPCLMHEGRVVTVNATTVYGGLPFVYFIDPKSVKRDYYRSI
jgi:diadenosine tetraphosphatase ApaH/serine/threonine PP2A family protein phosphatase